MEQLAREFVSGTPRIGLWLDRSQLTPEQTVDAILSDSDHEELHIGTENPSDGGRSDARTQPPPADVAIDRDAAVTITWADGHRTRLALDDLRRACPCARCQQLRRTGRPVWSGDAAALCVAGAELVGGWGLGLAWSDGHATGVHEWSVLRASCPCGACR